MTVTINTPQRLDGLTWRLTWSSDLSEPVYRVYQDGLQINTTEAESQDFSVSAGETLVVEILDTDEQPSLAFPGRWLIGWSKVADIFQYRIDKYIDGIWVQRALINNSGKSFYTWKTRFLEDSTEHQFRVVPIGTNGNDGEPLEMSELMVRHPDPPEQIFSYNNTTQEVTINA